MPAYASSSLRSNVVQRLLPVLTISFTIVFAVGRTHLSELSQLAEDSYFAVHPHLPSLLRVQSTSPSLLLFADGLVEQLQHSEAMLEILKGCGNVETYPFSDYP